MTHECFWLRSLPLFTLSVVQVDDSNGRGNVDVDGSFKTFFRPQNQDKLLLHAMVLFVGQQR